MFLLDTNTISYYFRGEPSIVEAMHSSARSEVAVPSIVSYEIRSGLARLPKAAARDRLERFDEFLAPLVTIPFDEKAAQSAAIIRSELDRAGEGIGPHDVLIAATALAHGATLVSHNQKEFARVPGLSLVDWL